MTAIAIPWSAGREIVERPGRRFVQVQIALGAASATSCIQFAAVTLDGANDVPGSLQVLNPSDLAHVKAAVAISVSGNLTTAGSARTMD